MGTSYINSSNGYGYDFITESYIPKGENEYFLRNKQNTSDIRWKNLTPQQIRLLEANGNMCPDWSDVLVAEDFNPDSVRNSFFAGFVRIGATGQGMLRYHDFTLPEGITNSRIISCDIGSHCAVHNCPYISHYIIGDRVMLSSIAEMDTTNHSKAGNGIVKEGEKEDVRIWIDPLNEAGGRSVLPFYDMICADAWMWTVYRDDKKLMDTLVSVTQNSYDTRRGFYGIVGDGTVIKNCLTIKDVYIGKSAYIKGANKLKNLSVKSDDSENTQIGEGVELVNGIIGYGCRIFYGCKAVRFVMGDNCNLKYGARLIHSILGDNSTGSCCEVLNNLVFPGHEQHHNNSFLIATMIMGQSNMAAGATVGSNHNSRGNDGEIIAGRGFWPGLSSTLKHNCRFASFTLITKGNYPHELNIPLPFSMLIESTRYNRLEVMPAYWWMYNMYALERNSWKYRVRDKRKHAVQHIETDYLAPDTVCEIIAASALLEEWTAAAAYRSAQLPIPENRKTLREKGRQLLLNEPEAAAALMVTGEDMERSKRPGRIIKPAEGYAASRQLILFYAVKTLVHFFAPSGAESPGAGKTPPSPAEFARQYSREIESSGFSWVNMGGQLVPERKFDALRADIRSGKLDTWYAIHDEYERLFSEYPLDKAVHAFQTLLEYTGCSAVSDSMWNSLLDETAGIQRFIAEQVYKTKLKDYTNTFRKCTYRNTEERDAVLGHVEDNAFIKTAAQDADIFIKMLENAKIR